MKKSTWVFIAFLAGIIGGGLLYRHFAQDTDFRGATRLMRALEDNKTENLEELLRLQGDVNRRDKSGQTALFYAARHASQPKIIHQLVLAGADVFITDNHGYTALMSAAENNNNPAVVTALAHYKGPTGEEVQDRNKALSLAVRYNNFEVIKTLLIAHASPEFEQGEERKIGEYIEQNKVLTSQEKTDLRQILLLLEILQGRERFVPFSVPQPLKKETQQAVAPKDKKEKKVAKQLPKPVEKQMEVKPQDDVQKAAPAAEPDSSKETSQLKQ